MRKKLNKISAAAIMTLTPGFLFAAETGAPAGSGINVGLLAFCSIAATLLIVILLLSSVVSLLSDQCKTKFRNFRGSVTSKVAVILIAISFASAHAFAGTIKPVLCNARTMMEGVSDSDFNMLLGLILVEFIVIFILLFNIMKLKSLLTGKQEYVQGPGNVQIPVQKSWFWDNFNQAIAIEKETDILMDHDYDGVRELDNSLPPWWKWGFYITIGVGVVYFFLYIVTGSAPNSREEYLAEMKQGEAEKAAYLAKAGNSVDENNVTLLTDAASLGEAKEIFEKNCSPCHLKDGGGLVGPNLTDEYWIHGGGIKDIFKTIKYGYMDKGMKSWKDDFSPKQIQELASFVKSLKGTKPLTPKAPQGELYVEQSAAPANDTSKVKK